jgi:hypothetical protein
MDPLKYELAIRYVFDRCRRYGDPGANASTFDVARMEGDFSDVARHLARALVRIEEDATSITWSDEEKGDGGIHPNFALSLRDAREALARGSNQEAAFVAVSSLVHALKALVLKASPNVVPDEYVGRDRG